MRKLQCLFWYHLGDKIYRLPFQWSAELYQYAMWKSVQINDNYDLKIWKQN